MNRYRAILIDPGKEYERPVQIFGNDLAEIVRWAHIVVKKAVSPDAHVIVHETAETEITRILKEEVA